MTTIAICNLKGGTGKTTTTIFLAHALTEAGDTVTVIDADPQGSATEWADRAEATGHPLPFPVTPGNARSLNRPSSTSTMWTLIDCPPGIPQIIDAAIKVADHVIIPTRPSGLDVERMWDTLDIAANAHPKVLLTSTIAATRSLIALRKALKEDSTPIYSASIPQREAIKNCFGNPIAGELFNHDSIAEELRAERRG